MRFQYWTIQATPDPTLLMTFGVGVLVVDSESQDFQVKFINRLESMPNSVPNRKAILNATRHLEAELNAMRSNLFGIEFTDFDSPSSYASQISNHWNNLISVDHPRFMSASNLGQAADLLFRHYIENKEASAPLKNISTLRTTVRKTYESVPVIEENLHSDPLIESNFLEGYFDLAVVREDNRIFELNSSFTFLPQQARANKEKIEAWNFRISQIRNDGGLLFLDGKSIQIDKHAPVVVTYSAPVTEQQRELYEPVFKQWNALEILAVPETKLREHSDRLQLEIEAA